MSFRPGPMHWPTELDEHPVSTPTPTTLLGLLARLWDLGYPRARRWWHRRAARERLVLIQADLDVQVSSPDLAMLRFTLRVCNFTKHRWEVEGVELEHCRVVSRSLPEQTEILRGFGFVEAHDIGWAGFSASYGRDGVRTLQQVISPATTLRSSPSASTSGRAWIRFRSKDKAQRVLFEFDYETPRLSVPILSRRRGHRAGGTEPSR